MALLFPGPSRSPRPPRTLWSSRCRRTARSPWRNRQPRRSGREGDSRPETVTVSECVHVRVPGCARHLGPGVQVPSRAGPIRCFLKLEERAVGLGVRLWPCDSLVQNFHTVQPPARVLLPPLRWADGRSSLFLGASGCCLSRFHLGQTLLCRSPRSPSSDPVKCRAWACRRPVSTLGLCVHTCAHALHACVQWARQPWSPIHPDPGAGAPFQALTQSLGWKEGVGGVLPFVLLARHSRTFHRKRSSVAACSVRCKDHRGTPPPAQDPP